MFRVTGREAREPREIHLSPTSGGFIYNSHENAVTSINELFKCSIISVLLSGLAMSEADRERMKSEINIVFHSAATIQFNDLLSKSVSLNVRGTKELVDLAKEMKNLISFVHVSTCYLHCHLQGEVIREEVYPPEEYSVKDVLNMCEHNQGELHQYLI